MHKWRSRSVSPVQNVCLKMALQQQIICNVYSDIDNLSSLEILPSV